MDFSVTIGGKKLANPVGVASGTFGYGAEYEQLVDFSAIGALYTKAVTLEPRPGNDIPRIIETPSGLLNSIGLANVGVDSFIAEKMPQCRKYPCAIVVNVAGATAGDYAAVLEKLEPCRGIWGYEINVSCPNVKHGGMAFGTDPAQVQKLTKRPAAAHETPACCQAHAQRDGHNSDCKSGPGGRRGCGVVHQHPCRHGDRRRGKKAGAAAGDRRAVGPCDTARWRRHDLCGEQSGFDSRYRHGRHIFRETTRCNIFSPALQLYRSEPRTSLILPLRQAYLPAYGSTAKRKKFPR